MGKLHIIFKACRLYGFCKMVLTPDPPKCFLLSSILSFRLRFFFHFFFVFGSEFQKYMGHCIQLYNQADFYLQVQGGWWDHREFLALIRWILVGTPWCLLLIKTNHIQACTHTEVVSLLEISRCLLTATTKTTQWVLVLVLWRFLSARLIFKLNYAAFILHYLRWWYWWRYGKDARGK